MMRVIVTLALLLVLTPLMALAQVPTPDDPTAFFTVFMAALQAKQWAVVGILVTIGLVWVLRKLGTKISPFFGTRRGGALLALVGGCAVALAGPVLAGTPLSLSVITDALVYGIGAAGGWTLVRRLIFGEEVPPTPAVTPAPQPTPVSPA